MTKYEKLHVADETLIEYETLHTNFIGNQHEDENTIDKAIHDFLILESENALK